MLVPRTFLFLFGTVIASCSGAVISGPQSRSSIFPSGFPFYSQSFPIFVQSSTSDCKHGTEGTAYTSTLTSGNKPIIYSGPLPTFTMPEIHSYTKPQKLPISMTIVGTPMLPTTSISGPVNAEPIIAEVDEQNLAAPVESTLLPEELKSPVIIPEPPMLPPFTMPELPTFPELVEPIIVPDESESLPAEELTPAPLPEQPKPAPIIPEAPVLPAFIMPELPTFPERSLFTEPIYVPEAPAAPEPLPEQPKPAVIIPEAPMLPPFTMPELPKFPEPIVENLVIPEVPESIPVKPAPLPEQPRDAAIIPEAPMLPPFTMPELPTFPERSLFSEPIYVPEAPAAPEPLPEQPKPTVIIPEAPMLPPFTMPEIPTFPEPIVENLVIPEAPESIPVKPAPLPEQPRASGIIPEAPILPPFTMPGLPSFPAEPIVPEYMPETEARFVELAPAPCAQSQPTIPEKPQVVESFIIPEAPILPPFQLPEMPAVNVSEYSAAPIAPSTDEDKEIGKVPEQPRIEERPTLVIPEAPMLPPFQMPELPVIAAPQPAPEMKYEEPELTARNDFVIPEAPVLPPLSLPEKPEAIPEYHNEFKPISQPHPASPVFVSSPAAPTLSAPGAPSPIYVQAPMQIIIPQSEIGKLSGDADCLYKYLTDRIVSSIVN